MKKKSHEPITNAHGKHPGFRIPGYPIGFVDEGRAILAQEAQGSKEVVSTAGTRLPTDGTSTPEDEDRCHNVGIKLGPKDPTDHLFREA